jgi:hypothetical protein
MGIELLGNFRVRSHALLAASQHDRGQHQKTLFGLIWNMPAEEQFFNQN